MLSTQEELSENIMICWVLLFNSWCRWIEVEKRKGMLFNSVCFYGFTIIKQKANEAHWLLFPEDFTMDLRHHTFLGL